MKNNSNDQETHDSCAITEVRISYVILHKRLSRKNMNHAVVLKISIKFSKPLTSATHFHLYLNFLVLVFFFFTSWNTDVNSYQKVSRRSYNK